MYDSVFTFLNSWINLLVTPSGILVLLLTVYLVVFLTMPDNCSPIFPTALGVPVVYFAAFTAPTAFDRTLPTIFDAPPKATPVIAPVSACSPTPLQVTYSPDSAQPTKYNATSVAAPIAAACKNHSPLGSLLFTGSFSQYANMLVLRRPVASVDA